MQSVADFQDCIELVSELETRNPRDALSHARPDHTENVVHIL